MWVVRRGAEPRLRVPWNAGVHALQRAAALRKPGAAAAVCKRDGVMQQRLAAAAQPGARMLYEGPLCGPRNNVGGRARAQTASCGHNGWLAGH